MQHYDVTSLLTICKIFKGVQILEKFGWIWLFQQVQGYRGGGRRWRGGGGYEGRFHVWKGGADFPRPPTHFSPSYVLSLRQDPKVTSDTLKAYRTYNI